MSESHNKRRLSFFSFGLNSTSLSQHSLNLSTSPGASVPHVKTIEASPSTNVNPPAQGFDNKKLSSALSLSYNNNQDLSENPDSNIFERSVQEFMFEPPSKPMRKPSVANISRQNSMLIKNEDLIPPALDATTSIFNDKDTNLDDVEMIYSNRRNSSVLGLNMALGRPFTPSRKNSVYSMSQQLSSPLERTASNFQQPQPQPQQQPQSPVSPPKLTSSKSSLSFYSYADMINNDEYARRPSFKQSYSQGIVPTVGRKQSVSSNFSPLNLNSTSTTSLKSKPFTSQSQLSRQLSLKKGKPPLTAQTKVNQKVAKSPSSATKTSPSKFLISPESSDSEDNEIYYPALNSLTKRKSLSSQNSQLNSILDDESLVSSSIGDCIRQSTTEINGH